MTTTSDFGASERSLASASHVERFVREITFPNEHDPRVGRHGPSEDLVREMREHACAAGLLTPNILPEGTHLTQVETAWVLRRSGLSPLGPVALNTAAPDEGNMFWLGKIATSRQRDRSLAPLHAGAARSAFFMTEPAATGGAGSDLSMLQTRAVRSGEHWVINGRKAFITGADGASVGIVTARTGDGEKAEATCS